MGMIFFTPAFALPTKSHACLYTFDKPIKLLYFCLFVDSVLFTCFHFKVIQKSPYGDGGLQNSKSPDFIFPEVVLLIIFWLPLIIVSFVKSPKRKAAAL